MKKVIGGQAVMEGVMMRSPTRMAMAVRRDNGSIAMARHPVAARQGWAKAPFVRGVVNFASMLKMGFTTLNESMALLGLEEEEPSRFEKWLSEKTGKSISDIVMTVAIVIAVAMSLGIFFLLPTLAATWLSGLIRIPVLVNLAEGVVRMAIFMAYLAAISRMNDIQRFFAYHGAEHKVVNCYEADLPLTVENAQKQTTQNPRCGTSFLLIVMLISVVVFSLTGWSGAWWSRFLIRIALLPVVASISYEVLMLLSRKENACVRVLRWPGMQLQRMTTRQPTDDMVEVALAAFVAVLEPEERAQCVPEDYRLPDEPKPAPEATDGVDAPGERPTVEEAEP